MAIIPETKNWTWVVERACPDCGFDPTGIDFADIPALTRDAVSRWPAVLARPDVGDRPDDHTWSPLEYGAHVRDVCRVFRGRVQSMLARDEPMFENWDQDEAAIEGRYRDQGPAAVSADLVAAAERLCEVFDAVPVAALDRRGLRGDGAAFTVRTLALYFVHEPIHHLHDVHG